MDLANQPEENILRLIRTHPDITRHSKKDAFLEIIAGPEELALLTVLGFPSTVSIDDIDAYAHSLVQQGYLERFHTYAQMLAEMQDFATRFGGIAKLYDIGDSWEKTQGIADREIWAIKISDNVEREEIQEPEVLYMGCHHAREIITPEIVIHFMHYLLDNYGADPQVTFLVDNRQIWLVPMVNPDGHQYVFDSDLWWRKNRRDNGDGTFGVDLNRNYGYMWGYDDIGSSPNPGHIVYRGMGPFSEPETQAIRDLAESHNFVISLSYHSYGNLELFPWGYVAENTPDHEIFKSIADSMAAYNGYEPGNAASGTIYITNGDVDDWLYGEQSTKYKVFGLTPEVGSSEDGFHPDTSRILPLIQENLSPNLYVAMAAETHAPRPLIVHVPLRDTEDVIGPYAVLATFTSPIYPLDPTSLYMHYNTTGVAPFDSALMTATGLPQEYSALIPSQGNEVRIYYYLSASDSIPRTGYAPAGAPDSAYSFYVGTDLIPPVVVHDPLGDQPLSASPFQVTAVVSDNRVLAEIYLEWLQNEQALNTVTMLETGYTNEYAGWIEPQSVQAGDLIEYRLVAVDSSSNITSHPATGYHAFTVHNALVFDFEETNGGFVAAAGLYDVGWEWGVPTSGPSSPHSGIKVWATNLAGDYYSNSNSRLDTPPVRLPNTVKPALSFWHWYQFEYSGGKYWDGGNVKISADGGPFQVIAPTGGYDGVIDSFNAFLGGEPAFGGPPSIGNFWHQETFDLSAFAGDTVVLRFHFGSDEFITAPDWYIDDVVITLPDTAVTALTDSRGPVIPDRYALLQNYPNPFNPSTTIGYELPKPTHIMLKVYDVIGQQISTLVDEEKQAGRYEAHFSAGNFASGVYFYRISAGNFMQIRRMVLVR